MLAFANAKINIGLNVTEKLPSGYHNIETVFYPIKIHDVVEITDAQLISCKVAGIDIEGNPEDNLCYKAFRLLQKDYNFPAQQITLLKQIPIGAGLGGGSSDAAHLIKVIDQKFNLGLSVSEMEQYAAQLGADCAFFIQNKPVYAYGKGDQFMPLTLDLSAYNMVLVKPEIHVSTAEAYAGMIPQASDANLIELVQQPLEHWKNHIKNDFERMVFEQYPAIRDVKNALYRAGALYAAMSGSGSSVYGIFDKTISLPELEQENKVYYNL
ncbi:4-(cytidine 5'-diphospho)-2-C-methyl-D-erythritol kinase [Pedobacter sp. SAFR-022]|uniref:4-(cytidine 5'-diphospho)-2-C-methyl-D-erythritol kinase n=1 Tax=Pedobacter sp. SAFR-022 TaxID=3436861 RepID=UPI003F806F60